MIHVNQKLTSSQKLEYDLQTTELCNEYNVIILAKNKKQLFRSQLLSKQKVTIIGVLRIYKVKASLQKKCRDEPSPMLMELVVSDV